MSSCVAYYPVSLRQGLSVNLELREGLDRLASELWGRPIFVSGVLRLQTHAWCFYIVAGDCVSPTESSPPDPEDFYLV